jgi:ABC-type protease/lipase transport system fused ATPase/permease subunit
VEQLIAGWKSLVEVRGAWRRLHSQVVNSTSAQALRLPPVRGEVSLERVVLLADVQRPPVIKGVSPTLAPENAWGFVGPSAWVRPRWCV